MLKRAGKGKYFAASSKGRRLSKRPKSKRAAMKQLAAVHASQARRKRRRK
tara:strand:- start:7806 stop:7955 length:150 start_codon:yes stop_codon:yes gene_type:complete